MGLTVMSVLLYYEVVEIPDREKDACSGLSLPDAPQALINQSAGFDQVYKLLRQRAEVPVTPA